MSAFTRRDAEKLCADIRRAKIAGHSIAASTGGRSGETMAAFLGGLESVLRHFLLRNGAKAEVASLLSEAMNYVPTADEIAEMNSARARLRALAAKYSAVAGVVHNTEANYDGTHIGSIGESLLSAAVKKAQP